MKASYFSVCFVALQFGFLNSSKLPPIFHVALNQKGSITLDWTIDYSKALGLFEIHLPANFSWFAFGFSDRGEAYPSDLCVLWKDYNHKYYFQDTWADHNGILHVDEKQDCLDFRKKLKKDVMKYIFERKFDSCDDNDYVIKDGTTHIVWSVGTDTVYKLSGLNISTTSNNTGMVRTQILKNINSNTEIPRNTEKLEILTDKVEIPDEETTYWCHVHKLPEKFKEKHHILQYAAVIQKENEGVVHHMEVFRCMTPANEEIPLYKGSCFAADRPEKTQVCKRVLAAWAMGAAAFTYPEEAALPIGGPEFNLHIMLEIHYNNPQKMKGLVDSSGVAFYITSRLRSMDAGVIEFGLEYTDKMAIPPGQTAFPLSGYCVAECTAVSLPPEGITIFGSQLHTHLTGAQAVTRHFRDGIELPELNRDDHYSTHFQEIRRLKRNVKVLPGDALITTCYYNTENRENITLGGFAISDEMCVNYIHYFPATALEVCKSAISDNGLSSYFQYMNEWENQDTSKEYGVSDNYKAIEWNNMRVQLLKEVYSESPLSMQCNMSSGDRFPGYWENTPLTPILKPLAPPYRLC